MKPKPCTTSYTTRPTATGHTRGYVMVFPEGVQDPASDLPCRGRSWNAGTCCGEALVGKADDIGYLVALLKHAKLHHTMIDERRIFISGASNGGSLTVRAACELGKAYFAGAAANVASFEPVRGEACATNCTDGGDGYWYCQWDQARKGCREDDYLQTLPSVYECKQHGGALPLMLFNGNFDPYSSPGHDGIRNNTGLINYPTNSSCTPASECYNISFPLVCVRVLVCARARLRICLSVCLFVCLCECVTIQKKKVHCTCVITMSHRDVKPHVSIKWQATDSRGH